MSILLRNLAHLLPDPLKYGPEYNKTLREIKRCEKFSDEQMRSYQLDKLKEMLSYAARNTVYYNELFDRVGFSPSQMTDFSDLEKIPLLTKDIIRQRSADLISMEYADKKLEKLSTSGSTGEPAVFYSYKREAGAREAAFVRNAWNRIGYDGKGVTAVFRGAKIPVDGSRNVYWETPTVFFKDTYSSYHINKNTVAYYVNRLVSRKTKWIMAFPSVLYELCICANADGYIVDTVKGIFLSSEVVHGYQTELMKRVFPNAEFNLIYGHTERACFASSCGSSLNYHFQKEYGFTEFRPAGGGLYEIIATGFNNHAMPLIRYATGDVIDFSKKTECGCGLPYDIFENIGGRSQSYIVTKSGQRIVETAFIASVHSNAFDKIEKMQFEQFEAGSCTMKVKPLSPLTDGDIRELVSVVTQRLNNDADVRLEVVDDIPPGKNGKNKLIIQHSEQ